MLNPQTIGTSFPHGYAGSYSRQPDMIIQTYRNATGGFLPFGTFVVVDPTNKGNIIYATAAADVEANVSGIVTAEVKTALGYPVSNDGGYAPGELVPVMIRGRVNVKVQMGTIDTTDATGKVYLRTATSASYPAAVVGGLEAATADGNALISSKYMWGTTQDAWRIAELIISSVTPMA